MKVLNLYAGIGGNRKLWEDVEVTAIENNPQIAKIYQDFFPNDKVIIEDAHQYLLDHFKEFDFIWSSPPCPTHSRLNFLHNVQEGKRVKYPNMDLYQEIIFLKTWFKGKYCVENVISYYDPLIRPYEMGSHYFWTNFFVSERRNITRGIIRMDIDYLERKTGFSVKKYKINKALMRKILNNCVEPYLGLHILNESKRDIQGDLFR